MLNLRNAVLTAMLLGSAAFSGCAGRAYYVGGGVVGPPPPAAYGVAGYAPGAGYVWTDGYYDLRGSSRVWVGGRWMRPPHPRAVWVTPRWERYHGRYRFHRGYWR